MPSSSVLAVMASRAASLIEPVGPAPWRLPAETAEYIFEHNSIEVPAADSSLNAICSVKIEPGYAAIISHVLFNYVGNTAPQDGNAADILYSLRVDDGYFPRSFKSIPYHLGSLDQGPYPVPGYIRLNGGQKLEALVSVPVDSPIGTGVGNFVIAHLLGWQWQDRGE